MAAYILIYTPAKPKPIQEVEELDEGNRVEVVEVEMEVEMEEEVVEEVVEVVRVGLGDREA